MARTQSPGGHVDRPDSGRASIAGPSNHSRDRKSRSSTRRVASKSAAREGTQSSSGGSVSYGTTSSSDGPSSSGHRNLPIGSTIQGLPSHLLGPDDNSAEEEYERYLQRQFQHRLRTIDRPSTSLLSRLKGPLSRASVSLPSTSSIASPSSVPGFAPPDSAALMARSAGHGGKQSNRSEPAPASSASADIPRLRRNESPAEDHQVSQNVLIWQNDMRASPSLQPSGKGSFAPKVTRKLANLAPGVGHRFPVGSSPSTVPDASRLKQVSPKLKERSSRTNVAVSRAANPSSLPNGVWREGQIVLREDNHLCILEQNGAMPHNLRADLFQTADIRAVHETVFGRYHVLGIYGLPSNLTGGQTGPRPHQSLERGTSGRYSTNDSSNSRAEPVFICFPSARCVRLWEALLRACGMPDVFGHQESWSTGGTHRWYRQLDLQVTDFRPASHASPSPILTAASPVSTPLNEQQRPILDAANLSPTHTEPAQRPLTTPTDPGQINAATAPCADFHADPVSTDSAAKDPNAEPRSAVKASQECSNMLSAGDPAASTGNTFAASGGHTTRPGPQRRDSDALLGLTSPAQSSGMSMFVELDGSIAGRADARSVTASSGEAFWSWSSTTITIKNVPRAPSLSMQLVAFSNGSKQTRSQLVGSVDLPVQHMVRGEDLHFWFPVWAAPEAKVPFNQQASAHLCMADECVGELMIKVRYQELAVQPKSKYSDVRRMIDGPDCADLIASLTFHLDEDQLIEQLVNLYTSLGSIADRIADLLEAESHTWDVAQPELLFRGNTLLSRALDKFQRNHCREWLDVCIGNVVRDICREKLKIDSQAVHRSANSPVGSSAMARERGGPPLPQAPSREVDQALGYLQRLWDGIYSNRHTCPRDLRAILCKVRRRVNAKFPTHIGRPPGIQGVGLFLFLRLFCPAITSPHQYGLVPSAPDAEVSKSLKQLAKMLWDLTAKRGPAEGKDKDPWSRPIEDYIRQSSSASDDFIAAVSSSERASQKAPHQAPLAEDEDIMRHFIADRTRDLWQLHREAVSSDRYMLDPSLALASLASFIARKAPASLLCERPAPSSSHDCEPTGAQHEDAAKLRDPERAARVVDFVRACCKVEERTGYCVDKAGLDPEPLSYADDDLHAQSVPFSTVATGKAAVRSTPPETSSRLSNPNKVAAQLLIKRDFPVPRRRRQTVSTPEDEAVRGGLSTLERPTDFLARAHSDMQCGSPSQSAAFAGSAGPRSPAREAVTDQRPKTSRRMGRQERPARASLEPEVLSAREPLQLDSSIVEPPGARTDARPFDIGGGCRSTSSHASRARNHTADSSPLDFESQTTSLDKGLLEKGEKRIKSGGGAGSAKFWSRFKS
ncbi:unnamed protein product [Parajaminaea phylloscopi]